MLPSIPNYVPKNYYTCTPCIKYQNAIFQQKYLITIIVSLSICLKDVNSSTTDYMDFSDKLFILKMKNLNKSFTPQNMWHFYRWPKNVMYFENWPCKKSIYVFHKYFCTSKVTDNEMNFGTWYDISCWLHSNIANPILEIWTVLMLVPINNTYGNRK